MSITTFAHKSYLCLLAILLLTSFISWAKAPALYVTMSQVVGVVVEVHFLDLAFRAQLELRNVKVKVTLR